MDITDCKTTDEIIGMEFTQKGSKPSSTMKKPSTIHHFICLLGLVLLFPFASAAQSRLSIRAADSLAFMLILGETNFNSLPCLSVTLDMNDNPAQAVTLKVPSHPEIVITQSLVLKKNTAHFYEIEKKKGKWKLVLKSESTIELSPAGPVTEADVSPVQESATSPQAMNETPDQPADSTAQKGNCAAPVSVEVFEAMIREVDQNVFESRKLEVMKNFVSSSCIRVEQMRYMISRLSMEDNKVILAKAGIPHIYDLNNLYRIEEDFFLEKNKARVHELIITSGAK